ncbi:MAG: LLM class F420-dependent oxidoreductase [Chloroflexi bacterium]|nr:LLM class F420-dependent oxidoreductase [Chloroflexota bacterium]
MLDLAIMIEGQNGLNWQRWMPLARAAEDFGFAGLYRSDHFTNGSAPDLDSLECWVSLAWLASHTKRIQFGTLVSPLSFRHPTMLARMARDVDDLSGGRFTLGVGAGWQEREHTNYGFDLLPLKERFERFRDGLEIITRLFSSAAPVTYAGKYYRVNDAVLLPRPQRSIPILIGGRGPKRTLALAARYAREWNTFLLSLDTYRDLSTRLDEYLAQNSRSPGDIRRSLMTGILFGKDDAAVQSQLLARGLTAERLQARAMLWGTPAQIAEQLGKMSELGIQRVMVQWLDLDDLDGLETIAKQVIPQLRTGS